MKKIVVTAFACIFGLTAVKAQLAAGNSFVGTSIAAASYAAINNNYIFTDGGTKMLKENNYAINVNPSYGVFLTDHLVLAGMLTFDYASDKTGIANYEGSVSNSTNTIITPFFNIGPFMRYYFFYDYFYYTNPPKAVFYLQAGLALGAGGGSSSGYGSTTTYSYVTSGKLSSFFLYQGTLSLGMTYFIRRDLGTDFSLGYNYLHEDYDDFYNTTTTTFSTHAVHEVPSTSRVQSIVNGISIGIGFNYFIE